MGLSYARILRGREVDWRNELFFEHGSTRAIRTENLNFVGRSGGRPDELFDLEEDPASASIELASPHAASSGWHSGIGWMSSFAEPQLRLRTNGIRPRAK